MSCRGQQSSSAYMTIDEGYKRRREGQTDRQKDRQKTDGDTERVLDK
jgi:hypothetical protein